MEKDVSIYLFYDNLAKVNLNVFMSKNDLVMKRSIAANYNGLRDYISIEKDIIIKRVGTLDNQGIFIAENEFICNLIDCKPISKERSSDVSSNS